jgi:hypothetical protein
MGVCEDISEAVEMAESTAAIATKADWDVDRRSTTPRFASEAGSAASRLSVTWKSSP